MRAGSRVSRHCRALLCQPVCPRSASPTPCFHPPRPARSLAHPNVIQGYKCCVARRLDDDDDAFLPSPPSSASDGSSCELASAGERAASRGRGGGRVVPHLTDSNCRVQVMERDAVLGPGNYEL